jgi:two-component system phosphate regulon sensor histidine kinase PhoR
MRGLPAEFGTLFATVAAGALLGALAGRPLLGAFLALLGLTALRTLQLRRFALWIDHALGRPPPLSPILDDVGYRLWRQRRAGQQRTRRLTAVLRRLRQATQALPDAAVMLDADDGILWFNEAGARFLGLEKRDLGQSLGALLRAPPLRELLQSPDDEPGSVEIPSPTDERLTLDVRLFPYADGHRMILARDVSQMAQVRKMRQDFVANVSHELRTPLTVVIGYLEALEDEPDARRTRDTLVRLKRPTARMKTLVEDLLLLSRLDSDTAPDPGSLYPVEVAPLLRRIAADARALGDERHDFELDVEEGLLLRGIDAELHSAFGNLVVNAVRYSPDGGTIRIGWHRDGDGARFEVADQGIGIAEEHLPRLTERFYRVDVGRSRDSGGTGLGLAIVKHVLRRHDSELEVSSTPGEGSTFSCLFGPERIIAAPSRSGDGGKRDHAGTIGN